MNHHYSARIHWSEQDAAFLAIVDELPGCVADGQTHQEALDNLSVVIDEWIEVAKEEGRPIPEPLTMEAFDQVLQASREQLRDSVRAEIKTAVSNALNEVDEVPPVTPPQDLWPAGTGNV